MLIYADESKAVECSTPEFANLLADYRAFNQEIQDKKGLMLGLNPLQPTATATTVRVRNEHTETTDGPFAETKEQLAGYYLLDCKDLDEAIEYAAKIPGAKYGSVEIRPILKFADAQD